MAYLPSNQFERERQEQQQQTSTALTSSAGGPSDGGGALPDAASPGTVPQQSTPRYPMITDYLRANGGAGQAMARTLSEGVGAGVERARADSEKAQSEWKAQNDDAISKWRESVASTQAANRSAYDEWTGALRRGAQQAWEATDAAGGRTPRNWTYNPKLEAPLPMDRPQAPILGEYSVPSEVTASLGDLQGRIGALGSESGRAALLSRAYGDRQPYSYGQRSLDAALVGQSNPQADLMARYGDVIAALGATPEALDVSSVDTSAYGDDASRPGYVMGRDVYDEYAAQRQADMRTAREAAAREEEERRRRGIPRDDEREGMA